MSLSTNDWRDLIAIVAKIRIHNWSFSVSLTMRPPSAVLVVRIPTLNARTGQAMTAVYALIFDDRTASWGEDEVVRSIWEFCRSVVVRHELGEFFLYDDERPFDPHLGWDGRENSDDRHPTNAADLLVRSAEVEESGVG